MKALLIAVFLLVPCIASAQSALIGKRLINVGDEAAKVREAGGAPDQLDKIPGDESQPPMEIWTYQRKGRSVTLWMVNDKIVQVEDKRAEAAVPAGGTLQARNAK
jgi:hypothetical protein